MLFLSELLTNTIEDNFINILGKTLLEMNFILFETNGERTIV